MSSTAAAAFFNASAYSPAKNSACPAGASAALAAPASNPTASKATPNDRRAQ
jgi:hypothetical protein